MTRNRRARFLPACAAWASFLPAVLGQSISANSLWAPAQILKQPLRKALPWYGLARPSSARAPKNRLDFSGYTLPLRGIIYLMNTALLAFITTVANILSLLIIADTLLSWVLSPTHPVREVFGRVLQ